MCNRTGCRYCLLKSITYFNPYTNFFGSKTPVRTAVTLTVPLRDPSIFAPHTMRPVFGAFRRMISPACVTSPRVMSCLLYTSDAADDLLCVDLGGRRIIK